MATALIRHEYDRTGFLPANLVTDETFTPLIGEPNLIVPDFGYFFKDSFVLLDDATSTPIARDKYKFTEYYSEESLKCGKEICGSVLIDPSVSTTVRYSYQALGGHTSRSTDNILAVHYEKMQAITPVTWDSLLEKPLMFKPKFGHLMNADEVYDWGRMSGYVVGIRDAILTTNMPEYGALFAYIDKIMLKIEQLSNQYLDDNMLPIIEEFKKIFTKQYLGLDKLVNMACASDREGYLAGTQEYEQDDITENKYMTLSALVSFKEALYEKMLSRFETNLGKQGWRFTDPVRNSILAIPSGSNRTVVGVDTVLDNQIPYSQDLYPIGSIGRKNITFENISHFEKDKGSAFHAFDHTDDGMYFSVHKDGDITKTIEPWKKYILGDTLDVLSNVARQHFYDYGNPHEVTKIHVELGQVENLPVVAQKSILEMTSERAYLTMDTLMYFMRAFLLQNAWHVEVEESNKNKFLLDNCQVVYSPCGNCGCDTPAENNCPSAGTELRRWCGDGGDVEFEPGSEVPYNPYMEGYYDLYGEFTDGNCGTEVRVIERSNNGDPPNAAFELCNRLY